MNLGKSSLDKWVRQLKNERSGITSKATPLTPVQLEIRELKKRIARIDEEKKILKKGYSSLDVGLAEQFTIIKALKVSHAVKRCCEVFNIHRSSYKYWSKQVKRITLKKIAALAIVKSIHLESNGSADARTIASIATTRGLALSRYVATRLMREQGLVSCQLPSQKYKKETQEHVVIPNTLESRFW